MQGMYGGGQWNNKVYLNNGHGWATPTSNWQSPVQFADGDHAIPQYVQVTDGNGDGMVDMYIDIGQSQTPGAYIHQKKKADFLTGITYSDGGNAAITYKASPTYMASGSPANPKLSLEVDTVSSISTNDGLGHIATTNYSYSGGQYYFNTYLDRKSVGFQQITATDPAGNITKTYYHQFNGTDTTNGEYQDSVYKAGKPYRIEYYNPSGVLYKVLVNKWDQYNRATGAYFVELVQSTTEQYDGTGSHADSAESYTYNTTTGNQTQKVQWGKVTANADGSFTDSGSDKFTTNTSYATNGAAIVGLPSDITMLDQGSAKVKETQYYYDSQSLGVATLGNQTKESDWISGSTYANTTKTYNSYGLVTQVTDPDSHNTTYAYDSYYLYPATVTNALSQATAYTYDYNSGKVTQKTDPNTLIWKYTYDGLGRPLTATEPDLTTPSTQDTKTTYAYVDTANAVSATQCNYLSAAATVCSYQYFDGLGRKIQDRTIALGSYITKDYSYNNLGLEQNETLPYSSSGSAKTSPSTTTALFITYTYDPLQRVTATTNNLGTTSNAYNGWAMTTLTRMARLRHCTKMPTAT